MSSENSLMKLLDGVAVVWVTLGDVGDVRMCKRILKEQTSDIGDIPFYKIGTFGKEPNAYISRKLFDEYRSKYSYPKIGVVLISASGTIGRTVIFDGQDAYFQDSNIVWIENDETQVLNKYLFYFYKIAKWDIAEGGTIQRLYNDDLKKTKIPIPPLEIQTEIVRILDTFTELIAELTAELQKRITQYRYYSTMLFDNAKKYGLYSIKEICFIKKGTTPIQKAIPGKYPMVVTTTERKSCEAYQFNTKAVCIPLVSSRGHGVASLNHVYYQDGKFALGNILCAITPKNEDQVDAKYLYYYFEQTKDYTLVPLMKGGANVALRMNDIEKVNVPIPPIEEQARIIAILDKFDALTSSINEGLPREIELRKQQYEYYREKLLSFPKSEVIK